MRQLEGVRHVSPQNDPRTGDDAVRTIPVREGERRLLIPEPSMREGCGGWRRMAVDGGVITGGH